MIYSVFFILNIQYLLPYIIKHYCSKETERVEFCLKSHTKH